MNPYAWAGEIAGGVIAVYLLSRLIEWVIVKRVMDDEASGTAASVIAAALLALLIYSLGHGLMPGAIVYPVSGALVLFGRLTALRRAREADEEG